MFDQVAPPEAPENRKLVVSDLVKIYHTALGPRRILDHISFTLAPGEKIAVLGRNGAGKSTLVKLIGGVETPTSGRIERGMFQSWPIAFGGGFELNMSGFDNIRFIARIYGVPIKDTIQKVDDFAELGKLLYLPVRTYSSGMRARLAFALTLAIDFECFLIDEIFAVGDQRFHRKCYEALFVERAHRAMVMVSHDARLLRRYCHKALILKGGCGRIFEDMDLAVSIYETL